MAGHSKWAKLKHGKEDRDRQKGNLFGKLSRDITMAVIGGGGIGDPEKNAALRFAIDKARQSNMPKENIARAVARAEGPARDSLKQITYEAFGPHDTVILINVTTDNPNRTHSQIKSILDKSGGKLAGQGAVKYLFSDVKPLFPLELEEEKSLIVDSLITLLKSLDEVDEVYTNVA